jgi:hypothetical protein
MSTLEQIEQAVMTLPDKDFQKLYDWIVELDHQKWNRQIAEDSERGVLDTLADQALAEHRQGRTIQHGQSNFESPLFFKLLEMLLSVRASRDYRALGVDAEDGILWFWMGTHREYDRLIYQQQKR